MSDLFLVIIQHHIATTDNSFAKAEEIFLRLPDTQDQKPITQTGGCACCDQVLVPLVFLVSLVSLGCAADEHLLKRFWGFPDRYTVRTNGDNTGAG